MTHCSMSSHSTRELGLAQLVVRSDVQTDAIIHINVELRGIDPMTHHTMSRYSTDEPSLAPYSY